MNKEQIEAELAKWWAESYGRPPGVHVVMTHVPFAMHILKLTELMREGDS